MNQQFQRIERLPPYVFNIIGELKQAARARGEDIIDFGMGNPDQPTPEHIVDKLKETVNRGDTHRYSQSKGIPRLRKAICNWYQSRYDKPGPGGTGKDYINCPMNRDEYLAFLEALRDGEKTEFKEWEETPPISKAACRSR